MTTTPPTMQSEETPAQETGERHMISLLFDIGEEADHPIFEDTIPGICWAVPGAYGLLVEDAGTTSY